MRRTLYSSKLDKLMRYGTEARMSSTINLRFMTYPLFAWFENYDQQLSQFGTMIVKQYCLALCCYYCYYFHFIQSTIPPHYIMHLIKHSPFNNIMSAGCQRTDTAEPTRPDINKPVRPLTSYHLYFQLEREYIRKSFPRFSHLLSNMPICKYRNRL